MVSPQQHSTANYERALGILREALAFGIEPSLRGVAATLKQLGDPQAAYPAIQVAGTNGKSSTVRFVAALLRAHGLRVGLYTSPELVHYNERMEVDGAVVSQELFAQAIFAARGAADTGIAAGEIELITEFELLTAGALWLFAQQRVDVAVLEVGLGGRWDATSVVNPRVAAITGVDFDHTAILGNTIEEIAAEKAAIIKPGSLPVLGSGTAVARDVFLARCTEVGVEPVIVGDESRIPLEGRPKVAPTIRRAQDALDCRGDLWSPFEPVLARGTLPGGLTLPVSLPRYQEPNIAVALAVAEAYLGKALDPLLAQHALDTLVIPGRFETLRQEPLVLIDAAHNPQSARVLAQALQQRLGVDGQGRLRGGEKPVLLLGILKDKDATGIIDALVPLFARIAVTQSASPRALPVGELAQLVLERQSVVSEQYATVAEALAALTAQGADVVATGSITIAGEVKAHFEALTPPSSP